MKNNLKNVKEVAERIKEAVQKKERIIVYGDSDMDGIASTVLLTEAIKNIGGAVHAVAFPDRENDGYGINLRALEFLKHEAPALFITLDLGIGNVKEVKIANELGFEVIIVDHHEILESLPEASIIIDPKQPGDESGLTHLANVGVTFKLCEELLGDAFSAQLKNSFYELAALATISDMVPQIGDNKMFIEKGLRSLKNTFRPGLRVFLDILGEGDIASGGYFKIISALNAAESVEFKNQGFELLIEPSSKKCWDLAEMLIGKVNYKQQKIKEITEEISRRISQKKDDIIIFEGDPAWKLTLAGPVASIVAQRYEKPTFIYKKMDTESCGSVRSLKEGENSVDAMKSCADILITYGGHPKASGFRLKNENLEEFKKRLSEYFKNLKT
ncbi:MAG: DHH family phosphoesterase [bacterium]|nr:DHH family phosphoesterase [bacterium]